MISHPSTISVERPLITSAHGNINFALISIRYTQYEMLCCKVKFAVDRNMMAS